MKARTPLLGTNKVYEMCRYNTAMLKAVLLYWCFIPYVTQMYHFSCRQQQSVQIEEMLWRRSMLSVIGWKRIKFRSSSGKTHAKYLYFRMADRTKYYRYYQCCDWEIKETSFLYSLIGTPKQIYISHPTAIFLPSIRVSDWVIWPYWHEI